MAALLFRLFPTIWPFIVEVLVGGKNHPHNFDRTETKTPIAITFLVLVVSGLGFLLNTTFEENAKLKLALAEAQRPSPQIQELSVDLYVCKRATHDLETDLTRYKAWLEKEKLELDQCLDAPVTICPVTPIIVSPNTPSTKLTDRAQRRLDSLRNKD